MTTRIHIKGGGFPKLQSLVGKMAEDAEIEISKALTATGIELRSDIQKRIRNGPATGRIYRRRSVTHQASSPGEAPASDAGRLRNSITFKKEGARAVKVFSVVKYAKWLEFGTRKIARRPAFHPAAQAAAPKLRARIEAAIARAIR